jgi:hypothetical protein
MAKTNAPLLSWGASGSIAKTQVYSTWKGRPYVRRHVIPRDPNTAEQQSVRGLFAFLNDLWKYLPSGALGAWKLYADNSRFTDRNGWIKQNLKPLQGETDLDNILLSVAAGGGIIAAAMNITPGNAQLEVALTAPALPAGWSITKAWALAVRNVDPTSSTVYDVASGSADTGPYEITLTGLTNGEEYIVGGWFEYETADGKTAYGPAKQNAATPAP